VLVVGGVEVAGGSVGFDVIGGVDADDGVLFAGEFVGVLPVPVLPLEDELFVVGFVGGVSLESVADGSADTSGSAVAVPLMSGIGVLSVIPLVSSGVDIVSDGVLLQAVKARIKHNAIMMINNVFFIKSPTFLQLHFIMLTPYNKFVAVYF